MYDIGIHICIYRCMYIYIYMIIGFNVLGLYVIIGFRVLGLGSMYPTSRYLCSM